MKIARIESFILGTKSSKDLLFCRVETDDGFYGWGEGYVTAGKETVIAECVKAMAPYVLGRSVFNIRHTGQIMFEDFAIKRGSPELLAAWSAVEIKLSCVATAVACFVSPSATPSASSVASPKARRSARWISSISVASQVFGPLKGGSPVGGVWGWLSDVIGSWSPVPVA